MVSIQIRTDILSVLIWVQTVYKGYQRTTKVPASKKELNTHVDVYGVFFGLNLALLPFFVYAGSKSSGETVRMQAGLSLGFSPLTNEITKVKPV